VSADHEVLASAYKHFNARNIDAVLKLMRPDVDWPNGMEGSRVHGHSEVREYWTRQWAVVDPHVDPVSFTAAADGRTVVQVHQIVRDLAGNILLDQMVQHIYLLQEGLIRRMEIRENNPS
jgi:hypothetical protein